MTSISAVILEAGDPAAAETLHQALGITDRIRVRPTQAPSSGFRGFTLSLITSQPDNVDLLTKIAQEAGATEIKPVSKSFWGYGGVLQAPDGTIWKIASASKKNTTPATPTIDEVALLLGCDDVAVTKKFYVEQGLTVAKSFGRKYAEFASGTAPVKLALLSRRAVAKDAGVPPEGTGSHRLTILGDTAPFTDPDGFTWENASA